MTFTKYNDPGAGVNPATYAAQAQPDKVDWDIIAAAGGTGVVGTGCAVTAQATPNMTVAVAAGTIAVLSAQAAVTSGNVTVGAADATNPRIDLIVSSSAGVKSCVAGVAAAVPCMPNIPAASVALAEIYVPAAATAITTSMIRDLRVPIGTSVYTRIAQTVLSGTAASFDFTSIPATYEDLVIEVMGRGDTAAGFTQLNMTFNGDTGSNYDWQQSYTTGNTASGAQTVAGSSLLVATLAAANASAGAAGSSQIVIPNYARTTFRKTMQVEGLGVTAADALGVYQTFIICGDWRSTAAINRVTLTTTAGNLIAGSVVTLYGRS